MWINHDYSLYELEDLEIFLSQLEGSVKSTEVYDDPELRSVLIDLGIEVSTELYTRTLRSPALHDSWMYQIVAATMR